MTRRAVIGIIIIILALSAGWLFVMNYHQPETPEAENTPPALTGYILMNLAPSGTVATSLYHYIAGTGTLQPSTVAFFTPRSSADSTIVAGVGADPTDSQNKLRLYLYEQTSTGFHFHKLPAVAGSYIRFPATSDTGIAAVDTLKPGISFNTAARSIPESWSIYTVAPSSTPTYVEDGLYPQWSPDGTELIFLTHDGLHVYDLTTKENSLVWPLSGGTAGASMIFDVSKDGKEIAWTNPTHSTLTIASITSWRPFSAHIILTAPVTALWPVISPDDAYVAFEQVDLERTATSTIPLHPRLSDVLVSDGTISTLYDLSAYDPQSLFITDWNDAESL